MLLLTQSHFSDFKKAYSNTGGEHLKKKTVFIVVPICFLIITIVGFIAYQIATDPFNEMYKDRTEYPLQSVDINDTSSYMLVKWQHSPTEKYEIITDTQEIKANVSAFSVDNDGSIYGTTADGVIWLFKDGKQIDTVIFDNTLTKNIEYGTLHFQQINELQYQLLIGSEIVEKGENYAILCNKQNEKPYYYSFAHGNDLESVETVYLLNSDSSLDKMARPNLNNGDIIEFVEHSTNYAGNQTRHWYFRLSDYRLSYWYWNVKAIKDNLIVYAASYMDGGKSRIIIHDMFDKSTDFQEVLGNFPDPRDDDFLLSVEFTTDERLSATYTGTDGQVHTEVFTLN